MLTRREWLEMWIGMLASTVLAAALVTAGFFGLCRLLDGDCRLGWGEPLAHTPMGAPILAEAP